MRTDDLFDEHADKNIRLRTEMLEDGYVLIEGDTASLTFLADLLVAVCDPEEDGRHFGPRGPGSVFFEDGSEFGLCLHRRHEAESSE